MFRIAKDLVQVSSPTKIPFSAMLPIQNPPVALQLPEPPDLQETADNVPQKTRNEAAAALHKAEKEAAAKLREATAAAAAKLNEVGLKAQATIAEAESRAQDITEAARLEGWQEGRQEGWQEGRQEGLELQRQQLEQASQELRRLLAEIAEARAAFFDSFEQETVELAVGIAEKIVLNAVNQDDAVFKAMIENALKHLRREGKISLHISEQQYNDFFKEESALFVLGDETIYVEVIKDPLLENGDLIVESEEESVNAGVSSQLKRIALAFGRAGGEE